VQLDLPLQQTVTVVPDATPALDVAIVRSARRRSLALHVSAHGKVELRAPLRASQRDIAAFLQRHRDWVLRKVADATASPPWTPQWSEGGQWYWQGEVVRLAAGGPRGGQLAGAVLSLQVKPDSDAQAWQRAVALWHRREAAALLQARAALLFDRHCSGHRLKRIDTRWMRATWGTCAGRRAADGKRDITLRLNLWLAALPADLCDAILLHELAHVEHMNHGAGFYRRLTLLNPGWREHDAQLKHWARLLFPVVAR